MTCHKALNESFGTQKARSSGSICLKREAPEFADNVSTSHSTYPESYPTFHFEGQDEAAVYKSHANRLEHL